MTRHVWVIPATGSPDASGREATRSEAEPTEDAGTTGRIFGRLRSKAKKDESPVSTSMTLSPVPEEGGMTAAPDVPHRKNHVGSQ
jgi:hypothetical protein